jgi:class 3 adenylate cyclase
MSKVLVTDIQNYIEENSHYRELLEERFINKERYTALLDAICQGLKCLGIPDTTIEILKNKTNFIIWLGYDVTEYKGYELPLYIGYKKMGLPISDEIKKKCPQEIITIIDQSSSRQYLDEFQEELKKVSFSSEIFLSVHKSILNARAEKLLSDLLSDIKQLSFKSVNDAIQKIPSIYLNYLSSDSLMKLKKKISTDLRDVRNKLAEELRSIELYSIRMKEQLQELYLETSEGLKAIVENEVQRDVDINTITHKASNLFSRLDRLFLGNIYHLRDYQKRKREIQQFLSQGEKLETAVEKKVTTKRKKISDIYSDYMFFEKFGPLVLEEEKTFSKNLLQELEQLYRAKSQDIPLLKKFEKKGLLSVQLEYENIKNSYNSFMQNVLVPEYLGQCLLEIITCLPPVNEPQRVMNDLANLRILSFESKNILHVVKEKRKYPKNIVDFFEPYRACATVLIYDIRGSSYMGIKLHNAVKEQKIKYKFAKEMAEIVKKYDGFLLKDTGDGGLVWFSENSGSLYKHLYTESITGRGMKLRHSIFSGAEFKLIPAVDAAKRAILCARDMVLRAEEFIRANFMHYREWFADVAERTLELDGITYALLPPEFKSLFRIGIGIASGTPDKDVVLAANSYGDPDLVGPILSDAHLYSMERQPGRSVITCDLPTLINVIMNIESFDYPIDETEFEKYIKLVEDIRQKEHSYQFSDHKITIEPKGIHILEELDKKKALVGKHGTDLLLDENGNLYNEHKKKIKLIYEILNIS